MSTYLPKKPDHKSISPASTLMKKSATPAPSLQAKLTIGQPNDQYEQEADRVADQVVNSGTKTQSHANHNGPQLQKTGEEEEVQTKPMPGIQLQPEEDIQAMEEEVQTKKENQSQQAVSGDVQNSIEKSKGGGAPLSTSTRSFMESNIGADFSKVRIHNDDNAHKLNAKLNAQAFAVGNNVFFNQGKFNPETRSGQHLLAHELTHVVQQKGKIQPLVQRQPKPKKVEDAATPKKAPTAISEAVKRKIVATALAEAHTGQDASIASIYLNLYKKDGEKGLKKSAAYSHKSDNYKIYMTVLGDKSYAKDKPSQKWLTVKDPKTKEERKAKSIQEYVNHSPYFKKTIMGESRAKSLKAIVDVWVLTPAAQPHRGWLGQGNLNDINNVSSKGIYWKRARAYFWVQKGSDKAAKYVKVLPAGKRTQFVFDSLAIQKYYQKHKMPASVKKITVKDL